MPAIFAAVDASGVPPTACAVRLSFREVRCPQSLRPVMMLASPDRLRGSAQIRRSGTERGRFELPKPLRVYSISSRAPSTTRPSLRRMHFTSLPRIVPPALANALASRLTPSAYRLSPNSLTDPLSYPSLACPPVALQPLLPPFVHLSPGSPVLPPPSPWICLAAR